MTPALKMDSDESHVNVSLILRDKVTLQCPKITNLLKRKESRNRIEPMPFCLPAYNALLLGQTGSSDHHKAAFGGFMSITGEWMLSEDLAWHA